MGTTVRVLLSGISLWIVALVIELLRGATSTSLWICIVGAALGVIGLIYSIRRLRREALQKRS
jgi:hypothetical protein